MKLKSENVLHRLGVIVFCGGMMTMIPSCGGEDDTDNGDNVNASNSEEAGEWLLVKLSNDSNNDGSIDRVATNIYDASGNPERSSWDNNNDGTVNQIIIYTYDYDSDGNIIKQWEDVGDDGIVDRVTTFIYTDSDQYTQANFDFDNNGSIEAVSFVSYNADGKESVREHDLNNDGVIEFVATSIYDTNGYRIKVEYSTSATEYYHNDAYGNPTKVESDNNNDGIIDEISYRTWQLGQNISGYTDSCLRITRVNSPEEQLFDFDFIDFLPTPVEETKNISP